MTPAGVILFVLSMAVKASLILAVAFFVTRLMRGRPAAERHLVWMLASICVLALPLLTLTVPSWRFAVHSDLLSHLSGAWDDGTEIVVLPASVHVPHAPVEAIGVPHGRVEVIVVPAAPPLPLLPPLIPLPSVDVNVDVPAVEPLQSAVVPFAVDAAGAPPSRTGTWLLLGVLGTWAAGALVVGGRLVASMVRVRRIERRARPLLDPALLVRAHGVAAQMGLPRAVRFLEGDRDDMPMTFGVLRPALLLPSSAREWSAARQNAVLRHELAHVRRRDSLSQLIAELGCAIHWFNPLMWWAARSMCVEREHACDDAVLASGSRASDYAAELLAIAKSLRAQRSTALAAIAMARPTDLRSRLNALLDPRPRRERTAVTLLVPAWLGAALLAIPLSSLAPEISPRLTTVEVRDVPAAPQTPSLLRPKHATPLLRRSADAAPAQAALQPFVSPANDLCNGAKLTNITHNSNDDTHTIKWSGPDCSGEVRIDGEVEFDADYRRITRISSDGQVRITTEEGRTERRVTIRPASSGVSYEYQLNGTRRDMDDAARAWLDDTMLFLFRRLGFMAEDRATAMLQRNGVEAVLAESELLASDHARAAYLAVAIERGRLNAPMLRRVLGIARASVRSDHYRSQIITAVAGNYAMDADVRDAYIAAVSEMSSDHYRHMAFSTLLDRGRLSPEQVSAVLRESGRIRSDHYRATLLEEVGRRYHDSPAIRPAYLEAAAGIQSDHYKSVVLMGLLGDGALSAAEQARVIQAAAAIKSDHYRAQVLEHVADDLADPALQRAFVQAAAGISSDHYLQRILSLAANQDRLDRGALLALLTAAERIRSDHYRAALLIEIAEQHRLDGDARSRFEQLMNAISSSHYRGNVATALLRNTR